jgi:uncharacterized membrane protein YgdD (TMEM256/DUF423 family)
MGIAMSANRWIALGALFAAVAVAAGAVGAHALREKLDPAQLANFDTAARYQLFHALGLIAIGQYLANHPKKCAQAAAWLLLVGIIAFSGGLYGWVLTGFKPLVHIVPLGGIAWIIGWLLFAISAWRANAR